MEVAGEVEVDVLHGDDLGVPTARGTALDAEDRPERGLSQGHGALDAATAQGVGEADRGGGLALARGRGVDGGHENELSLMVTRLVQKRVIDFGLVEAVRDEVLGDDAGRLGNLRDRPRLNGMGDFDIGRHGQSLLS